jgi:hypothetical protein
MEKIMPEGVIKPRTAILSFFTTSLTFSTSANVAYITASSRGYFSQNSRHKVFRVRSSAVKSAEY